MLLMVCLNVTDGLASSTTGPGTLISQLVFIVAAEGEELGIRRKMLPQCIYSPEDQGQVNF
jgi:hypothetical protein